jgi:NADPH:quinone reductase-like Zn-dependent oxidoreductase
VVGSWLCKLLKSVGARVIGAVRTAENVQRATDFGAEFVIIAQDEDVLKQVMDITGGEGVAAVFDGVGKATFDQGLQVLARDGTMVSYGNSSGTVTGFEVDRLKEKKLEADETECLWVYKDKRRIRGIRRDVVSVYAEHGRSGYRRGRKCDTAARGQKSTRGA